MKNIRFLLEINYVNQTWHFYKHPEFQLEKRNASSDVFVWGDPIFNQSSDTEKKNYTAIEEIVNNISGHFYFLLFDKKKGHILLGNSFLSLLPLYYYRSENNMFFSDNALEIGSHCKISEPNKRFILETVLFNYPLFNHSILKNIFLLPVNSYIKITERSIHILDHTHIEDFFHSKPIPWRKTIEQLKADYFQNIPKYFPSEKYMTALTGGFDGRTLSATGLYFKRKFDCYSFGTSNALDTKLPPHLAKIAGLDYYHIKLDDNYAQNKSLDSGLEFVQNASGTASFARAHYLYAAKVLAKNYNYIITGNFGSEIFRAAHIPGIMFAENLIALFNEPDLNVALLNIKNSSAYRFINEQNYEEEWEALKHDLKKHKAFQQNNEFTQNQKFYIIIFEEVFRKYFGAEMVNQFQYIKNRTPFLDFNFVKSLLSSKIAGVYSEFFEENPFKRFKGQVLYAHIIAEAFPLFNKIKTDKGYAPGDLLSKSGNLKILFNYIKKRLEKKTNQAQDQHAVEKSFIQNLPFLKEIRINEKYFNPQFIDYSPNENTYRLLSLSWLIQKLNKDEH